MLYNCSLLFRNRLIDTYILTVFRILPRVFFATVRLLVRLNLLRLLRLLRGRITSLENPICAALDFIGRLP